MKRIVFRIIKVVLILLLLLGIAGAGLVWWMLGSITRDSGEEIKVETQKTDDEPESIAGIETIALFGVDSRDNKLAEGTRSDSIMLAELDHDQKKVKIASIYRDSYLKIEGHGFDKVNHAHSFGGPGLAVNTLNENFDLGIQKYVTINFHGIVDLIDDLGGVEINLTDEEIGYLNRYIDENNRVTNGSSSHITSGGTYLLDGEQALAYTRIRYTSGGDYRRAERQRTVVMKMFDKVKELSPVELTKLAKKYMKVVNTNLGIKDVLKYAYYAAQYDLSDSTAFPTKFWSGKMNGVWYEVPVTLESNATELHQYLYPEEEYTPSETLKAISAQLQSIASTPNKEF